MERGRKLRRGGGVVWILRWNEKGKKIGEGWGGGVPWILRWDEEENWGCLKYLMKRFDVGLSN